MLYFLTFFYKTLGKCEFYFENITKITAAIDRTGSGESLYNLCTIKSIKKETVSDIIQNFLISRNTNILENIILLLSVIPDLDVSIDIFFARISQLSKETQEIFLNLILKQPMPLKSEYLNFLFPPWRIGIDCKILSKFIKKYFIDGEKYLDLTLMNIDENELVEKIDSVEFLADLIFDLFEKTDPFTLNPKYIEKIIRLVSIGSKNSIVILENCFTLFPPIVYKEAFIKNINNLSTNKTFTNYLPYLIPEVPTLSKELLVPEFINWCLNEHQYDTLIVLAMNGPYPIIDKCIIEFNDFSNLTQKQIINLIYAQKINSNDQNIEKHKLIRIPSLTNYVEEIELPTLFDLYSVSSYLIDNELLSIDNNKFVRYGIQYLSSSLANKVIDNSELLYKLTNIEHIHFDVFQFQNLTEDSFIYFNLPFSFDFKVENISNKPTIICEFKNQKLYTINNSLIFDNKSFEIDPKIWNKISFKLNTSSNKKIYQIFINKKLIHSFGIEEQNKYLIGSSNETPKTTFYINIHSKEENLQQIGPGILKVIYKGIIYYSPFINGIPRIMNNILNSKTEIEFQNYFFSLINISKIKKTNLNSYLRIFMIHKNEFVTKTFIVKLLETIKDNYNDLFELFINYDLCYKLDENIINQVFPLIHCIISCDQKAKEISLKKYSLPYFLMDLLRLKQYNNDLMFNLINLYIEPTTNFLVSIMSSNSPEYISYTIPHLTSLKFPLENIVLLDSEMFLEYLNYYSLECVDNKDLFNPNSFLEITPSLIPIVNNEILWISLFILLVNHKEEKIRDFANYVIIREQIVKTIFLLIPFLFKSNNDSLYQDVVFTFYSLLQINDFKLIDYSKEIQNLLRIGYYSRNETIETFYYDTYKPKREEIKEVQQIHSYKNIDLNNDFVHRYFLSNNLFFDVGSSVTFEQEFLKTINDITYQKIPEQTIPTLEELKLMLENEKYNFILLISSYYLAQLKQENKFNIFTFGFDNFSNLTIPIHQYCILNYIQNNGINETLLTYLKDVIIIGWWDNNLFDLFKNICDKLPQNFDNLSNNFIVKLSKVFCLIFGLTNDFSQYNNYYNIIFHPKLLNISKYYLFIYSLNKEFNLIDNINYNSNNEIDENYYNKYLNKQTIKLKKVQEKINKIRFSNNMYDFIILNYLRNNIKTKLFNEIEQFSFKNRYNILSIYNERSSYKIWKNLPQKIPTQFQVPTSVHPVSVPTLYVPFISNENVETFNTYGKYIEKINSFGAKIANPPPNIMEFSRNYFFDTTPQILNILFQKRFFEIESYTPIQLIFSVETIDCILAKNKTSYFIITNAKLYDKDLFCFIDDDTRNLVINSTFLDYCSSKYYGENMLFFGHPILYFNSNEITISTIRQFCHVQQCIEIWFESGYSLLLIFNNIDDLSHYETLFKPTTYLPYSKSNFSLSFSYGLTTLVKNKQNLIPFQKKWISNRLSSFAYLLILNFFSDRSFSNTSQYPVMPWVLPQRNLSLPMGQQDKERAQEFNEKYQSSYPNQHFYGSLYSSPAIIFHFMMRIQPFTNFHIDLQNGFDVAERLFYDIENEYLNASRDSSHNVEELIPELFMLPEIFINVNHAPIPELLNGNSISNCTLNHENNWITFIWKHRKQLDDTNQLEKWIDLIFGYCSRGQMAIEKFNLFYPSTYGIPPKELIDNEFAFNSMKRNFGQVPTQLFITPHPARDTIRHSRWPLLTNVDHYSIQNIKTFTTNESPSIVIYNGQTYGLQNVTHLFTKLLRNKNNFVIKDDFINWISDFNPRNFFVSSFSYDKYLFAGAFLCGSLFIFKSICNVDRKIIDYKLLNMINLPKQFISDVNPKCLAISSHLFLVCEGIGSDLFCFHVSTGRFIRKIMFNNELKFVLINDSYQVIFGVGENFIEVFTINGTKIASELELDDQITAASLAVNDNEVYLTTGHKSGKVRFWIVDTENEKLLVTRTIDIKENEEIWNLEVLNSGSALFVITKNSNAYVITARGIAKQIIAKEAVLSCAGCGKGGNFNNICQSCSLFFCDNCCRKVDNVNKDICMCKKCLERISECSGTIDEF